jgi:hypothetical protein
MTFYLNFNLSPMCETYIVRVMLQLTVHFVIETFVGLMTSVSLCIEYYCLGVPPLGVVCVSCVVLSLTLNFCLF